MFVTIHLDGAKPVYRQIMDQIRDAVREENLTAGTALPSVRQLATDLEINPNTVAKAYTFLEREDIVASVPRRGVFIAEEAYKSAARSVDQRVDVIVEAVLQECAGMGVSGDRLLSVLRKRLAARRGEAS